MDALREDLITEFLGPRYAGRRYLRYGELEALGIVGNRATLKLWIDAGAFPPGIRIAGPYGRTLVWSVPEVVGTCSLPAPTSARFPHRKWKRKVSPVGP
jgi:hypothetical protein